MSKLQFTVYEFMSIVGYLDEQRKVVGKGLPQKVPDASVYDEWIDQWRDLEKRSDALAPMERADLLFDGKVTINAITADHLREVIQVVEVMFDQQQQLIDDDDPDADMDDLVMWRNRLRDLNGVLASFGA